ncbi:MAG: polyprenyl synthetase family protein [Aquificaceae bacterium]|nr:polyprenyl synthetase family protein [Aquificaceae bacterium]
MEKLALWKKRIEEKLRALLKPFEPIPLYEAMSYYPLLGGKRIRPLIVCGVTHALGGDLEDAVTVGCGVELLHNYSLVHDDLPALDNDVLRRGKPTCHVVFGEDMALLAGDALLTYAFEVLSRPEHYKSLGEKELLFLVRELAFRSGPMGMVGGQALDVRGLAGREEISLKKTAQLFVFCFLAGGVVARRQDILQELETLGLKFGLLFQMVDDLADKDGFYQVYGDRLLDKIEELRGEYYQLASRLGLNTPELLSVLELALGGGGGIRTPGGL